MQPVDPLAIDGLVRLIERELGLREGSTTRHHYARALERLLAVQPDATGADPPDLGRIRKERALELLARLIGNVANCVYIDTDDVLGDGWDVGGSLDSDNSHATLIAELEGDLRCMLLKAISTSHPWSVELRELLHDTYPSEREDVGATAATAPCSPAHQHNPDRGWDVEEELSLPSSTPISPAPPPVPHPDQPWEQVCTPRGAELLADLVRANSPLVTGHSAFTRCVDILSHSQYPGDPASEHLALLLSRMRHHAILSVEVGRCG